jgi:hypothetical protein
MAIEAKVRARIAQLIEEGRKLSQWQREPDDEDGSLRERQMHADCEGWFASSLHIIQVVCPDPFSVHRTRANMTVPIGFPPLNVARITAILEALIKDVDAGVMANITRQTQAELFDDFLDQAQHWLGGQRIQLAGVVAGVVFEDAIRRSAAASGITEKDVALDLLITDLTKAGKLTELKAKRARSAAGLRTKATHAQWDEFKKDDVEDCIRTTRDLIDHLLAPTR